MHRGEAARPVASTGAEPEIDPTREMGIDVGHLDKEGAPRRENTRDPCEKFARAGDVFEDVVQRHHVERAVLDRVVKYAVAHGKLGLARTCGQCALGLDSLHLESPPARLQQELALAGADVEDPTTTDVPCDQLEPVAKHRNGKRLGRSRLVNLRVAVVGRLERDGLLDRRVGENEVAGTATRDVGEKMRRRGRIGPGVLAVAADAERAPIHCAAERTRNRLPSGNETRLAQIGDPFDHAGHGSVLSTAATLPLPRFDLHLVSAHRRHQGEIGLGAHDAHLDGHLRILYLSYWGIDDGLTASTVLPHLAILASLDVVSEVVLCTIEHAGGGEVRALGSKLSHIPLRSRKLRSNLAEKSLAFGTFGPRLAAIVVRRRIDAMICRGSLAGSLGLFVHATTRTPYFVESFEPHVEYAVEAGAWSPWGPKALFLRATERLQRSTASGIMPVAEAYAKRLLAWGVPSARVRVVPCGVDLDRFAYSADVRAETRRAIGIGTELTAIYVGKFGGIYHDREFFETFGRFLERVEGMRLILLTPHTSDFVQQRLSEAGIEPKRIFATCVPHDQVPSYLCAADFAFSLNVPSPSKRFLSPIKHGEYWACGLPIVATAGVGDEADFLERERAGIFFDPGRTDMGEAVGRVLDLVNEPGHRTRIATIADRYRSFRHARHAYEYFLNTPRPS